MPITTEDRLREIYGPATGRAVSKQTDHIDHHCRAFIAASPFLLIATSDGTHLDVSPKGDLPGFVVVEDDKHLLIPDWPGNSRIDGLCNILEHPRIGLIFLIPTVRETLRVNGGATIHDAPELPAKCAIKDRLPLTVIRVAVEEVFLHCAKSLLRSKMWRPETWPDARPVPSMGEMIRDHAGGNGEIESDDAMIARYVDGLAAEGRS
ncbi:MAG TPA: pyridoxamine 5'-phosphate oxidase family protein [Thermohalobaculum sp.]|nr:pyridoxamine 5'-phosphate oxidase family protein [Thermohalobaculum sp.]